MLNLNLILEHLFKGRSTISFLHHLIINLPFYSEFSAFKLKYSDFYVSWVFCSLSLSFALSLSEENLEIFFLGFFIVLLFFFILIFFKMFLQSFNLWNFNFFLRSLIIFYFFFLLFFPFLFFFVLPYLWFFLTVRISSGILLFFFFSSFLLIIYLSSDKEQPFSTFYKKTLPIIFFFLFLSSSYFLLAQINLHYLQAILIIYNLKNLLIFYEEVWKPMILRSSLLWKFFRFCTPAPFFLFGLEEIILFWPPLIFTKLLNLNPKPAWIMQPVQRNFHYYLPLRFPKQFIDLRPELIKAVCDSSIEGHASFEREYMQFNSQQNLEILRPLAPRKHSIATDPRELVGFLYLAIIFPAEEWVILHSSTLLRDENLHVLNLSDTINDASTKNVIQRLMSAEFSKPAVFKVHNPKATEKGWFFYANDGSTVCIPLTDKEVTTSLDEITSKPTLLAQRGHRFETAFIPLNDFFVINLLTREVLMVQVKYFYYKEIDFLKDSLVHRFTNQDFTIIYSAKTKKFYYFDKANPKALVQEDDSSVLEKATSLELMNSKMNASEAAFQDKSRFQELQVLALNKAISEGPLLPKKVEIAVKTPNEDS